jgi:hypothetical protein
MSARIKGATVAAAITVLPAFACAQAPASAAPTKSQRAWNIAALSGIYAATLKGSRARQVQRGRASQTTVTSPSARREGGTDPDAAIRFQLQRDGKSGM